MKNCFSKPPIPEGYQYFEGKWDTGFVISRISDGSEFVWVPVRSLPRNGTLDGKLFQKQLGRRNFKNDDFSINGFYEPIDDSILRQIQSVTRNGGFYISRYCISKSSVGSPQSIKGTMPWVGLMPNEAREIAQSFDTSYGSHIPYGCEYDSLYQWCIQTIGTEKIVDDSTKIGNYQRNPFLLNSKMLPVGSTKDYFVNSVADIAGNTFEWSQERSARNTKNNCNMITRGGCFYYWGFNLPAAKRNDFWTLENKGWTAFRVVLTM